MKLCLVLVLCVVARTASADDTVEHDKSVATFMSASVTGAGALAAALGAAHDMPTLELGGLALVAFGPSAGHVSADETPHAIAMFGLRGAALVGLAYGLRDIKDPPLCGADQTCTPFEDHSTRGKLLVVAAGTTFLASAIYDFYDGRRAAERRSAHVLVAPAPMHDGAGVTVIGRF